MKYIDADRLKAKIEKMKGYILVTHFAEELLSFIDSLQQEQPSEDLDADITAYLNTHYSDRFKDSKIVDFTTTEAFELARHFYELGKQSREPVNEDLEEAVSEQICIAADKHIKRVVDAAGHPGWDWTTQDIADAFKAGAEWQKEQMLKDAVEGYVNYYEDSGGILMAEAQVGCPYHNGDKVKIIIVKEDKI